LLSAVGNFLAESRTRRESIASMAYRRVLRPLMPLWVDRTLRVMVGAPSDRDIPQWIDPMLAKRTGLATRLADRGGSPTFRQAAKRHQYRTAVSRSGASWWGYLYDRAMGSHGIEARHPFLDRDLVEYVLALPAQELFQAGTTKPLLRRSMRGILPEEIRLRTDKTSSLPFTAYSLRDKEGRHVTELFERSVLAEMGFVDGARVRDLCRNYVAGTTGNDIEMWMLVTAERWLRAHWR
ncbi:MAG: asparagine synthase C-terminal domain-containing protein, partial [Acidobacteriota bacterium]|nr:asparagine synthase C-terminal domain-containing protein [Acidobacteriota bacterium]